MKPMHTARLSGSLHSHPACHSATSPCSARLRRLIPLSLLAALLIPAGALAQQDAEADLNVVRLSPQIREMPLGTMALSIPRATIEKFLTGNRVVSAEAFESAPYIAASATGNLVIGAGDEVFLRGDFDTALLTFDLFRPGATYKHPESGEILGLEAIHLGAVQVHPQVGEQMRSGVIRTTRRELKAGDRLLARSNENLQYTFNPAAPESPIDGRIIGLQADRAMAAQYDAVVINRGEREGLKVGDLLGIFEADVPMRDAVGGGRISLPGRQVGEVMIYRTFEKLSYGLILNSTQPTSTGFVVRNL
jgi:hypothetical protein